MSVSVVAGARIAMAALAAGFGSAAVAALWRAALSQPLFRLGAAYVSLLCITPLLSQMPRYAAAQGFAKFVPVPADVEALQLTRPFTLAYLVDAEGRAEPGIMRHSRLRITLSYNGARLLYRSQDLDTRVIHSVLFDGRDSYETDDNSRIALIEPGFDFDRLLFCPLPGAGLPFCPLLASGLHAGSMPPILKWISPALGSESKYIGKSLYSTPGLRRDYGTGPDRMMNGVKYTYDTLASVVSVAATGTPKALWYDTFDYAPTSLGRIWAFYSHVRFQNVWLATKIKMRRYAELGNSSQVTLVQRATYSLVNAADGPLPPSAYMPTTYLPDHANITDLSGPTPRAFTYYAGKGSLESQRGHAMDVTAIRASAAVSQAKSPVDTALVGLALVLVASTIWYAWRRARGDSR